ncbi:MAG: SIS domain-containing protein [Candidatus Gastranaerophilales bacterium]|nr:SIS domain-containing protein [Candidatus Gastranaerophilales bacterium]
MKDFIRQYIQEAVDVKCQMLADEALLHNIENIVNVIVTAYKSGKKVLFAGNGGSAADSQHLACELVSKFRKNRKALCAFALTVNTSILTAVANDFEFNNIFSRQINACGAKGDVFFAISTSGSSGNIIEAVVEAKKTGLIVVALTGSAQSDLDNLCDFVIKVPSFETSVVQEAHIMIGHIICALVEEKAGF